MKKRVVSLLMVACMEMSVLAGCGDSGSGTAGKEESGTETSETETSGTEDADVSEDREIVDLTFVYPTSATYADQEKINEALMTLAYDELGVNLTVKALPIMDCYTQLQLMIAGGEEIDVFPCWAANIASFVSGGYVLDIADYVNEEDMPNVAEWIGLEDVATANVNGYVWGVPRMSERVFPECIEMRKDILDELEISIDDIQSFDDVTEVFAAVHEAYPDMAIFSGSYNGGMGWNSDMAGIQDSLNNEFGVLDNFGETLEVINEYESDYWISIVKQMREWYEAGYVSKDMSTSQDDGATLMAAGNLFAYRDNYKPNTPQEKLAQTGYELAQYLYTEPLRTTTATSSLCYSVSGLTKNPDRAVEFLDWIFGSAEVNNLIQWGIENEHYVVNEEGTVSYPEGLDSQTDGYHNDFGWALPNQFAGYIWEGTDKDIYQQYEDYKASAHTSAAYGFSFDPANVEDEVIACQAIIDEYLPSITTGSVDPDTAIAEMNEKLYAAGLQTIMDEKQEQLDAWAEKQ